MKGVYVIIEFNPTFDLIALIPDEKLNVKIFNSRKEAENFAEKNCAWDYKIVRLN